MEEAMILLEELPYIHNPPWIRLSWIRLDTRPSCVIILQEFEKESFLFNLATVVVSHKRARVRLPI